MAPTWYVLYAHIICTTFISETDTLYILLSPHLTIGMMMAGQSLVVGVAAAAVIGNQPGSHHGRVNRPGILHHLGRNHRMIGVNRQLGNQPILGQVANLVSGDQQMMMIGQQAVVRQESMMMMIGARGLAKRARMMMIGEARLLRVVIGIRRGGAGIE